MGRGKEGGFRSGVYGVLREATELPGVGDARGTRGGAGGGGADNLILASGRLQFEKPAHSV